MALSGRSTLVPPQIQASYPRFLLPLLNLEPSGSNRDNGN